MRLIDADKIDFGKVFIGTSDFAKDTREAAQKLIDEQPTVYDVDKVVERLEKLIKKSYRMAVEGSHWAGAKYNAYREALEIVKAEIKEQEPEGGKKGNEKHADRFKQLFI